MIDINREKKLITLFILIVAPLSMVVVLIPPLQTHHFLLAAMEFLILSFGTYKGLSGIRRIR